MKVKQICMMVLLWLGVIPAVQAQTFDKLWKEVEQAEKKSLPKTVIKLTDEIYQKGEREKNSPQMLKAYTWRMKYREILNPDSLYADSYKQGIITDIRQVGGLPEYKGEAVVDSDGDGMPDAWEVANGLNPNDPADANMDCNGDGYTNIEKYINGIDTKKKVDWTDLKNNYDTLSKRKSLL